MRRELEPLQGPLACAAAVLLNFQHLLQVNRKYSCQTDDLHLKNKKNKQHFKSHLMEVQRHSQVLHLKMIFKYSCLVYTAD